MRTLTFDIAGTPGGTVIVSENNGNLDFTVSVDQTGGKIADLRGLFFNLSDPLPDYGTLDVIDTGTLGQVTDEQFGEGSVIDLGNGANMQGAVKDGFDVGVEFGTQGIGKDDLQTVDFTLDATEALTLEDISLQLFGLRLTSTGAIGGSRNGSEKLTETSPTAVDALDDCANIRNPDTISIDVLANDSDADGDAITIDSFTQPSLGSVSLVGAEFVFDPGSDFAGLKANQYQDVTFTYKAVTDDSSDEADVTVRVFGNDVGSQTDTAYATLANEQDVSLSLTTQEFTIDGNTTVSGVLNAGDVTPEPYNIVYVVDVSGSTGASFNGTPVGDVNSDGSANTILDAEIASLIALTEEIVARGFADADVDISVVAFSSGASVVGTFDPSQIAPGGALRNALTDLDDGGNTNFEAALQQTKAALDGQPDVASANNLVFFLSDGFRTAGGSFTDEAAALSAAPYNAEISAVGVGLSSSLTELNQIDNTGGAVQVDSTDELTDELLDNPLTAAQPDDFDLFVNGVAVAGVDINDLVPTGVPNQYSYDLGTISGLNLSGNNEISAVVSFDDDADSNLTVTNTVVGAPMEPLLIC